MLMKQHFYKTKSRWLLTTLLTAIIAMGGLSPAWAQKTLPYSYGFEDNNLATDGWTTYNKHSNTGISSDAKHEDSKGFLFYYQTANDQYLVSPELTGATANGVTVEFYYANFSSSFQEQFQVGYSTTTSDPTAENVFTWDDVVTVPKDVDFHFYTHSFNAAVKYIAIRYIKNDTYKLYVDDINITKNIEGPGLAVADGTNKLTSGYSYNFGLATAGTTHTFTLSNPGTEAAPISVTHTGSFGAELSATSIPAGKSVTLTVTMPDATGDDVITISSTSDAIEDFVINVSGTVRDASKLWCNFSEGVPTGWTNSGNYTITTSGAGDGTSGGGYAGETSYSYKLMYTPLVTIADGEKLYLQVAGYSSTASWNEMQIRYSADGSIWTTAKTVSNIVKGSWTSVEVTEIPAGNWYIGFYGRYVYFTDIYGGTESTAPVIALSQASYDFGLISANSTSSDITITNTGKSALTGLNFTSDNENFTVAVANDATEIAANGGTATFTVTMAPNATGSQSATITVKSSNADDLVFTATGAVAKPGTTTAIFNDATYAGWTASGSNLSYNSTETAAYFYYGTTNYLTSPKVNIAADDFLAVEAKMASEYGYVTVQGSADGTSWTDIKKLDSSVLNETDYTTAIVSGISTDYKYLRLNGYYCYVKQVAGLSYAPVLVVKDAENATQANGLTYPFGEIGANQTVTYNFTNAGAGTINITNVESSNAVFTTNFDSENKPAVTSAAPFTLTITANYDAESAGEQNGAITVTTTEGAFVINLTSTFLAANAPKFAVVMNETEQATGAAFAYGIITAEATKSFTIKNDGTGALNVTAITLPDDDFTTDLATAPSVETPLVIAAGTSQTINVKLAANTKAIKSGNIVISATNFDDFTLAATATVMPGAENVTFTSVPNGWDKGNWTLDTTNGDLYTASSTKPYLTTSKLSFSANDFIVVNAKKYDNDNGDYIQVQYSTDNGETWSDLQKLDDSTLPTRDAGYSDIVVSGIPETANKLRFQGYYARIKQISGLTYDANDPKLAVYSDAEATLAVTSGTAKDFGWVANTADATAFTSTYYIKNVGTGTLTITGITTEGCTATTAGDAMTIAANAADPLALTITMDKAVEGVKSGIVTLTTDGGNFTIPVSGFVYGDKNLIDFTAEGAKAPAGWSMGNWSITGNQLASGSSSTQMTTTSFTAAKGEKLYVEAISTATSYYHSPALTYSINGGEDVSIVDGLTSTASKVIEIDALGSIEGDETTVNITFTGQYVAIRRIYGFTAVTEPIMTTTAADIAFGMQTAESDEQSFTISNEGTAVLKGLSVTLAKTGDDAEYSVALYDGENVFTGTELAIGQTITVKVKQLYDITKTGTKSDVLTIAAAGQTTVTINLTGATRDGSKFYADFEDGSLPTGWTANTWSVTTSSGNKVAYAGYTASSLISTPMTVAENEVLTFKASRQYSNSAPTIQVRYTTNGGVTWSEYQDFAEQVTSSDFTTIELTGVPAGTAVVEIYGRYFYLDEISGFTPTTGAMFALTESTTAVANNSTKAFGDLTADGTATYTLTNSGNADMVSTVATTGVATAAITTSESEGVTISENTVTLAAGKTATITLTVPFASPYGEKEGAMTITTEGWVGDYTLNYTANTIDPTALYIDFADNAKPEAWYNGGWSFTGGYAYNYYATTAEFVTQKLTVSGTTDALTYKVAKYSSYSDASALTVEYSADRKNWTAATEQPSELTTDFQQFSLSGLEAGDYYVKFTGAQVKLDDIFGWHKVTGIDHDLYVSATTFPTAVLIPGTENGVTATATVNSLRAAETGVYAKLLFGETEIATAAAQDISLNGSANFTLTGNVPAAEGTYAANVVVYYSDNSNAFETATTDVVVEHIRTLEIASFTRTDGDGTLDANSSNQISPVFSVTVKNTGTTEATPTVKIYQGETEVASATAAAAIAKDETSDAIALTATDMSAGEGGALEFTAKVFWNNTDTEAKATSATPVTINVNAAAPKFELADANNTAMTDGDDVAFGMVREATAKTFTIKNTGNKALELVSIVAPEGYEATAVTDANKTVGFADGSNTLPISVTLKAEQGKKSGDLVITYKVDATSNATFTLALSGRSIAADTWAVDFEDGSIPANWDNSNSWTVYETEGNHVIRMSGWYAKSIMTPRLAAEANEELTFDVLSLGNVITYAYSTDKTTWSEEVTITATGEQTFTAPAGGNYYLRFTGRNAYLDNFVGFRENPLDHDTEIAAATVPATGTQYGTYTAAVTLKENVGKAEQVTATLYVNNEEKAAETQTITANGQTTITLTWKPDAVIETAVEAYIAVTADGIDLQTDKVDLTIAAPFTLSDTEAPTFADATTTYEALVLYREFVKGWNTVCLPFAITDIEAFFGAGAKAYTLSSYADNTLKFTSVTTMTASYPYVVYVPAAIASGKVVENVEIGSAFTTPSTTATYFVGTYAPIDDMTGLWGIASVGNDTDGYKTKIVKGAAGSKMNGFRAYFTGIPTTASGAPALRLMFDDEVVTGISAIELAEQLGIDAVYDMNGHRLNTDSKLQKGVYVVNGKKVVIK